MSLGKEVQAPILPYFLQEIAPGREFTSPQELELATRSVANRFAESYGSDLTDNLFDIVIPSSAHRMYSRPHTEIASLKRLQRSFDFEFNPSRPNIGYKIGKALILENFAACLIDVYGGSKVACGAVMTRDPIHIDEAISVSHATMSNSQKRDFFDNAIKKGEPIKPVLALLPHVAFIGYGVQHSHGTPNVPRLALGDRPVLPRDIAKGTTDAWNAFVKDIEPIMLHSTDVVQPQDTKWAAKLRRFFS